MLLGNVCTRACAFCAIPAGQPETLDVEEPQRVADAARRMNLRHVVLTSVARDDQSDGGAGIFAQTITSIRRELPTTTIEVLTPDFAGNAENQEQVLAAGPDVYNHNLETVRRLQSIIRPQASYGRSLGVLQRAARYRNTPAVKSGIMLGLGETDQEVEQALCDLVSVGCEILTLGQYLQPTRFHASVDRFVPPEEFDHWAVRARELGFSAVASGPMVRSSYKAENLLDETRRSNVPA